MVDIAYVNALKRKDELESELREIEDFLLLYRRFSGTSVEQIEPSVFSTSQSSPSPQPIPFGRPSTPKLGPSDYVEMSERAIRDAGRPLTRGELAEALIERGVTFPTEDVPRYLGTILWRNKERFINVPGRGYTLREIMTPDDHDRIFEANTKSAEVSEGLRDEIRTIARSAYSTLKSAGSLRGSELPPHGSIPAEIDRQLLNIAGEELGRKLFKAEKLLLREAFHLAASEH